jgi:type IV pilus biogenesis protein PilP
MQSNLRVSVLLIGLLANWSVQASSTADDLTRIETETAVMKARLKLLDVQGQVATRQAEINRAFITPVGTSYMPTVAGIDGVGNRIYASLQMENGSVVEARQGDKLPNGMVVRTVTSNEVVVSSGKRRLTLKPASDAWASQAPALPPPLAPTNQTTTVIPSFPPMRPSKPGDSP